MRARQCDYLFRDTWRNVHVTRNVCSGPTLVLSQVLDGRSYYKVPPLQEPFQQFTGWNTEFLLCQPDLILKSAVLDVCIPSQKLSENFLANVFLTDWTASCRGYIYLASIVQWKLHRGPFGCNTIITLKVCSTYWVPTLSETFLKMFLRNSPM